MNLPRAVAVLSLAANLAVFTAPARGSGLSFQTFTNPSPAADDNFGKCVAAFGGDRLLIGAGGDDTGEFNAGVVYLFSTNGALLTTFTNPTPAAGDWFGDSVAAVGQGCVLVGAPLDNTGATDSGAAYLFNTNGLLLTTFTNPIPSLNTYFASSVAAFGTDRVLIGGGGTGARLFSTNGTLLTTFPDPGSGISDYFGISMTAIGSDRVLIGSMEGAYLFRTNGELLMTFSNPLQGNAYNFGYPVLAIGIDQVVIGATGVGAYSFSTNGAFISAFRIPPALPGSYSMTMVGHDRVLIGAYTDNTGADRAGAAYLFSTDGALLAAITNPTPAYLDFFGWRTAAVGPDRVLIGAHFDDTGDYNAGVAYLFSIPPHLTIRSTVTNTVAVS